jgi:hypothetical protein
MLNWKRLILLGMVAESVAAATLGVGTPRYCSWRQRLARGRLIDSNHYKWIELGMRRSDVEALLGGPAGDFRTRCVDYGASTRPSEFPEGPCTKHWMGDQALIQVDFNEYGGACVVAYAPAKSPPEPLTMAEQIKDWVRRLWH